MKPTPIREEIQITLDAAFYYLDAEPDAEHPNPREEAAELFREAFELAGITNQEEPTP